MYPLIALCSSVVKSLPILIITLHLEQSKAPNPPLNLNIAFSCAIVIDLSTPP